MPTKRKKITRKRVNANSLEDWQVKFLLTGDEPQNEGFRGFSFCWAIPGEPSVRHGKGPTWFETWAEIKNSATVISWLKEHPGQKPFAWWQLEAPGNRKILECPQNYQRKPDEEPLEETQSFVFGVPILDPYEFNPDERLIVESQAAYLDRVGLLTDAEKSRLKDADFEPEILTAKDFE